MKPGRSDDPACEETSETGVWHTVVMTMSTSVAEVVTAKAVGDGAYEEHVVGVVGVEAVGSNDDPGLNISSSEVSSKLSS